MTGSLRTRVEGALLTEATPAEARRASEVMTKMATEMARGCKGKCEIWLLGGPEARRSNGPCLAVVPSRPYAWGDGRVYLKIFVIDCGDEPELDRLDKVEPVLRAVPEVQSVTREVAPNSMLKDMLYVQVLA